MTNSEIPYRRVGTFTFGVILVASGTAMLTAVGIGWFKDFAEAVETCVQVDSVSTPNLENRKIYENLFKKYKAVHDALAPIYQGKQ